LGVDKNVVTIMDMLLKGYKITKQATFAQIVNSWLE